MSDWIESNAQKKNTDWTEIWDQNKITSDATLLVDKILECIFEKKLELHEKFDLNLFELRLLYRWPIYIGVNIFIERLLRIATIVRNGESHDFPVTASAGNYFENTVLSVQAFYYDFSIFGEKIFFLNFSMDFP